MQYVIKDGHGKAILVHDRIPSYVYVAREALTIKAVLPLTVWKHNTITGIQSYDGERTRKLSDSVCKIRLTV